MYMESLYNKQFYIKFYNPILVASFDLGVY